MSRKLKPKRKPAAAKRQPPRWARDRNLSVIIWVSISITMVLVLALVGYWAYDNYVATWRQPVAKIGETVLDMDYFVKMLRYYSIRGYAINSPSSAFQILRTVEDNEVIRQGADGFGLQVSPEEVTELIASDMLPDGEQGNVTDPDTQLDEVYRQFLDLVQLTDDEYRQIVEVQLFNTKLGDYFIDHEVPEKTKHVHLHRILLDSEESAQDALDRLNNGEDFASLAIELSQDEVSKARGGDLDWVPRGVYPEYDEVAFSMEAGNVSEPILSGQSYSLIMVSEIDETRQIAEEHRSTLAQDALNKWFQTERDARVTEYADTNMMSWAMDRIG